MNHLITDMPDGPQFPNQILRQLILNRNCHFNEAATFGMKCFPEQGLKVGIAAIYVLVRCHWSALVFVRRQNIRGLGFLVKINLNSTEFKLTKNQLDALGNGRMVGAVTGDKFLDYRSQCEGR